MAIYSRIIGTGSYLPQNRISNHELEKWVDTSDAWIVERTGIRFRHIAANDETAATMATAAARHALQAAQLDANELDLILVATCTPDYLMPNTACVVQNALGIHGCAAFDISVACSGFCYGLAIIDAMIKTGMIRNALLIGSEVMSRVIDWADRNTCVLFGDGAGAVILSRSETPGILTSQIKADGQYGDVLYAPSLQNLRGPKACTPYMQMQGRELFKIAVNKTSAMIDELLASLPENERHIDWLIPHQANLRIIKILAEQIHLPLERVVVQMEEHANTSAASIPLALDVAIRNGSIQRGDRLMTVGFGGGFTWAVNLLQY